MLRHWVGSSVLNKIKSASPSLLKAALSAWTKLPLVTSLVSSPLTTAQKAPSAALLHSYLALLLVHRGFFPQAWWLSVFLNPMAIVTSLLDKYLLTSEYFLTRLLWPPPTGFSFISLVSPYFSLFFQALPPPYGQSIFLQTQNDDFPLILHLYCAVAL